MRTRTLKINRGKPVTELVKGSYDYTMMTIRQSFRRQFPFTGDDDLYFYVAEIFADHVIVASDDLPVDEFYYVTYRYRSRRQSDDGQPGYTFAPRDQWEVVELTYRPQSTDTGATDLGESMNGGARTDTLSSQNSGRRNGQRITEHLEHAVQVVESEDGKREVQAKLAQADVVNGNGRRYPRAVMREAIKEAKSRLREGLSQGRAVILGEAEHPSDKRQRPRFLEAIVAWEDLWFDEDDGWAKGRGRMISTSVGQDAIILMDAGVLPGISLRGYGESEYIKEDGRKIEEVKWLRLTGFDMVLNPSFHDAAVELLEAADTGKVSPAEVRAAVGHASENEVVFEQWLDHVRYTLEETAEGKRWFAHWERRETHRSGEWHFIKRRVCLGKRFRVLSDLDKKML